MSHDLFDRPIYQNVHFRIVDYYDNNNNNININININDDYIIIINNKSDE